MNLGKLNEEQRLAVEYTNGPLMVVAGPGTGKTRVLAYKAAYLINTQGIAPENILAITFTNHAAKEMEERIAFLLGQGHGLPLVTTFHSWAFRFLREVVGEDSISLIDEPDAKGIFKEAVQVAGLPPRRYRAMFKEMSLLRQFWPNLEPKDKGLRLAMYFYKGLLARYDVLDFDELMLRSVEALEEPETRAKARDIWKCLLVDEFQDVNPVQFELIRRLSQDKITVIGDPDQAIYGFRGADPRSMDRFLRAFPGTRVVKLPKAYRCHSEVLHSGAAVLGKGEKRYFHAVKGSGPRMVIKGFQSPLDEAIWVAKTIEGLTGAMSFEAMNFSKDPVAEGDYRPGDIAILLRTHGLRGPFEEALSKRGIPFKTSREYSPLERGDVRTIFRLHQIVQGKNPLFHTQKLQEERGLTQEQVSLAIKAWKAGEQSRVLEILGINKDEFLVKRLLEQIPSMDARELALRFRSDLDLFGFERECVYLMTMHGAKGLEFPVVFIPRCEKGIIPLKDSDLEEERRLFYVSLTRCSNSITITYSLKGEGRSPFLSSFPEETFLEEILYTKKVRKKKGARSRQGSLW